jgi:hypothetical protein
MGSRVSRPTGRTSRSVISANASAALRCKSTLSENDSVVNAESGDPEKKLVVVRSGNLAVKVDPDFEHINTHFQGTEGGLPPPLARFRARGARSPETS